MHRSAGVVPLLDEREAAEAEEAYETSVIVDGAKIWYRVSGLPTTAPDLMLVHGNGAHHGWWHAMLPSLEARHRVIQVDLSGHGNSSHRASYSPAGWAAELGAVLEAVGPGPVALVAHSMGGVLSAAAAVAHPDLVAGLLLFDSSVLPHDGDGPEPGMPGVQRVYPSRDAILERFRLMPPQPHPAEPVMRPVAEESIREVEGGWTWKQDQTRQITFDHEFVAAIAPSLRCPLTLVFGELSDVVNVADGERARAVVPAPVTVELMLGAHHHLVLEEPEECLRLVDEFVARLAVLPG